MIRNVGLVGLGPMGRALGQNLVDHGFEIRAWERSAGVRKQVADCFGSAALASSLIDMVAALAAPRCVLLFLPSGQQVDDTIDQLQKLLSPGDILVDCGNSFYRDTVKRQQAFEGSGIHLMGVGLSGGPSGARSGPAIMAGGDRAAWEAVQPMFNAVAAMSGNEPCCGYFGEAGAGHFIKMVHNGIEYGVMHLLAELYGYLENCCGMGVETIASTFAQLNTNRTAGYLTEITSKVVNARAQPEGQPLIDVIDDVARQNGTGRWSVEMALDLNVAMPTIAEAVMARSLSSDRTLREEYKRSHVDVTPLHGEPDTKQIGAALALALASTFAQGLVLFSAIGDSFGSLLDRAAILRTWRQGCILRGEMVTLLVEAFESDPDCHNVLYAGVFPEIIESGLPALRSLTADAIMTGVPMSGFASALAYIELLDGRLRPGRVIQLQRDYFGSHGLRDKKTGATFSGPWHEKGDTS